MARGLSLRALAKQLGLSGHGTLVDYEYGRRIPPEDLIVRCERVFQVSDGTLRNLREKALAERANEQVDLLLREPPDEPDGNLSISVRTESVSDPPPPDTASRPRSNRRWFVIAAAAVLLAAGAGIAVWRLQEPARSPSRTVVTSWSSCWGPKLLGLADSDSPSYAGTATLQITVKQPYSSGDVAICTAHGLSTLHPGMKVTAYLRVPSPEAGDGVRFFVYNSKFKDTWAPETPKSGADMLLPTGTDWTPYTFTVPKVDTVHTLGMEIYAGTDEPVILWLGAVTW